MNIMEYWDRDIEEKGETLETLCCGCGSCEQVCPKQAISMRKNSYGFDYPVIDTDKCIDCGLCVKKCQCIADNNIIDTKEEPQVYMSYINDGKALKKSSSGGIAYELGKYILEQNGVVFGAVYNDNMEIVHDKIDSMENLYRIQGSKYAQSKIGTTYIEAQRCLKEGRKVLYTGTPCQIGGLYHFLGKDYDNLYTVDLICYGVASPEIFKEYVKWKETTTKGKIKDINFRNKIDRWGISITDIQYHDRKRLLKYSEADEWYQTFIAHVSTRESCHHCQYTNLQRMSDVTVGDYWGIEKFRPDLDTSVGLSKVLINTDKGVEIFNNIKADIWSEQMPVDTAIRDNLKHPPKKSDKREKFIADYEKYGFYEAYKNNVWKKVSAEIKLKRWVKIMLKRHKRK